MLNWALEPFGLTGPATAIVAIWLVMSYLWLPYMILPIYAGLERIPNSLLEASSATSARGPDDLPPGDPAARLPGRRRRLDLHLLADPRRLHHARRSSSNTQFIGNVVYANVGVANNLPLAAAFAIVPIVGHDRLPAASPGGSARSSTSERAMVAPVTRWLLAARRRASTLAFIYIPLVVIAIYAFNDERSRRRGRRRS